MTILLPVLDYNFEIHFLRFSAGYDRINLVRLFCVKLEVHLLDRLNLVNLDLKLFIKLMLKVRVMLRNFLLVFGASCSKEKLIYPL